MERKNIFKLSKWRIMCGIYLPEIVMAKSSVIAPHLLEERDVKEELTRLTGPDNFFEIFNQCLRKLMF